MEFFIRVASPRPVSHVSFFSSLTRLILKNAETDFGKIPVFDCSCQYNLFYSTPMIWRVSWWYGNQAFVGHAYNTGKRMDLCHASHFFTHMSVTMRPRFLWSRICILGTISICLKFISRIWYLVFVLDLTKLIHL